MFKRFVSLNDKFLWFVIAYRTAFFSLHLFTNEKKFVLFRRHSIYAAPSSHALGGARNPLHHGVATYPHVDSYSNPYLFGPNAYSPPAAARPNLSPHSPIGTITVGSASQNSNNTSISAQSVLPGMYAIPSIRMEAKKNVIDFHMKSIIMVATNSFFSFLFFDV